MSRPSNQRAETASRLSKKIYWSYHVETWENSGQTQVQYCQENQLNKHTFFYWKSKLNKQPSLPPLLPVSVKADHEQALPFLHSGIVLSFNDRLSIRLDNEFNGDTLERLIDLLEKR